MTAPLDKTEKALKSAREQLATLTGKLELTREQIRVVEAERDEARHGHVAAEAKATEAIAARHDVITESVRKANDRADTAELELAVATSRLETENATLRDQVKTTQVKLRHFRAATADLLER